MNEGNPGSYVSTANLVLPRAIDAVGTADFYTTMLTLIGNEAAHSLLSLARYTRHAPPDQISLAPDDFDPDAMRRYYGGLYVMDPFYRFWYDRGSPGVVTLQGVAPAGMWQSPYATEFLRDIHIRDEVCVFLPPLAGSSVALLMDRAHADFTPDERGRVAALYPLLASLHALHIRVLLATASNVKPAIKAGDVPVRLVDGHGYELYKAPTWPEDPVIKPESKSRVPLGYDFVLAPGGAIEYIDVSGEHARAITPPGLIGGLTPRERDIVRLTLEGHPTISIARKLKLAVGTVKNHRTRIFKKLDITTERELFLSVYGGKPDLA